MGALVNALMEMNERQLSKSIDALQYAQDAAASLCMAKRYGRVNQAEASGLAQEAGEMLAGDAARAWEALMRDGS